MLPILSCLYSCGKGIWKWSVGILYSYLKDFLKFSGLVRFYDWWVFGKCSAPALCFIMISPYAIYLTSPVAAHLFSHRQEHDRRGPKTSKEILPDWGRRILFFCSLPKWHLKKTHRDISIPMQVRMWKSLSTELDPFFFFFFCWGRTADGDIGGRNVLPSLLLSGTEPRISIIIFLYNSQIPFLQILFPTTWITYLLSLISMLFSISSCLHSAEFLMRSSVCWTEAAGHVTSLKFTHLTGFVCTPKNIV